MQSLRPDQLEAGAATLASAFWDDPLMQIVAPDEKRRRSVAPWFFERALRLGIRWGDVVSNDDASAIAIWLPPGETELTPGRMLRAGMGALPFRAGFNGTMRFMRAMPATEKFHKSVKVPHWYLLTLGTSPERQGQGLGTALMEAGTSKADAAGLPCYLETATASNVAFYTKRGFEVIGQAEVLGFQLWGMVRQPK